MQKIDGNRRLYANLAKRKWYAKQRTIRYSKYLQTLAGKHFATQSMSG